MNCENFHHHFAKNPVLLNPLGLTQTGGRSSTYEYLFQSTARFLSFN